MDLLEAMRSTFSCRDFTDEPVPDAAIFRMLDAARFAPSGGNRQGQEPDPSWLGSPGRRCIAANFVALPAP